MSHCPRSIWSMLLAVIAMPVFAVEQPAVVLSDEAIKQHGVVVAPIARSTAVRQPVVAPATVMFDPDRLAQVAPVVAGRIAKLHVREGVQVAVGDPLVDIDSPELGRAQSEFLQMRAAVAVAKAALAFAEQSHLRAQKLVADNALPAAEGQRREADLLRAQTEVMAAEANRQAAENTLTLLGFDQAAQAELGRSAIVNQRLTLRASMAGTIIERHATVGQSVGPDTERLMTIADPSSLWILANVPEAAAAGITVGAEAIITGSALGDRSITTTVVAIAAMVDPQTRSVQVRLIVGGSTGLKPGGFVQVEIKPQAKHSSLVVPRSAIFTVDSMPAVFVPEGAPNRFVAREVELGSDAGDHVTVLTGLKEGDPVVVAGGFLIKADLGKHGAKGCCDTH